MVTKLKSTDNIITKELVKRTRMEGGKAIKEETKQIRMEKSMPRVRREMKRKRVIRRGREKKMQDLTGRRKPK